MVAWHCVVGEGVNEGYGERCGHNLGVMLTVGERMGLRESLAAAGNEFSHGLEL